MKVEDDILQEATENELFMMWFDHYRNRSIRVI